MTCLVMRHVEYVDVELTVYGLRQAPRLWYHTVTAFLLTLGFKRSEVDMGLFIRWRGKELSIISLYADDFAVASSSSPAVEAIISQLKSKCPVKDLGEPRSLLGVAVSCRDNHAVDDDPGGSHSLHEFLEWSRFLLANTPTFVDVAVN